MANKIQTSEIPEADCDEPSYDSSALNDSFTEQEVMEVILKLKSGKAAGTDRVLNEYILLNLIGFLILLTFLWNGRSA